VLDIACDRLCAADGIRQDVALLPGDAVAEAGLHQHAVDAAGHSALILRNATRVKPHMLELDSRCHRALVGTGYRCLWVRSSSQVG